jgi:hypothetical protein
MYQWRSSPEKRRDAADASRGNTPNPNTPTIWSVKRGRPIAKPDSGLTAPVSHVTKRRCREQGGTAMSSKGAALITCLAINMRGNRLAFIVLVWRKCWNCNLADIVQTN